MCLYYFLGNQLYKKKILEEFRFFFFFFKFILKKIDHEQLAENPLGNFGDISFVAKDISYNIDKPPSQRKHVFPFLLELLTL